MDKLTQISLDNTVTLKIDYILNQQLLVKNFGIIMDCLKDLKGHIDKHRSELNGLSGLKDLVDKLKEQINHNNNNNNNNHNNNQKHIEKHSINQKANHHDQAITDNLLKQINELKQRMTKNQGFITDNTKDINVLLKDMNVAKQDIEDLKKQLKDLKISHQGTNNLDKNLDKNLSKNDNLNNQMINQLNLQSQQHQKSINNFQKQMQEMKKHIKKLEDEMNGLKLNYQQSMNDKNMDSNINIDNSNNNNDNSNNSVNIDQKTLNDIMKKLEFLTKKTENIQSQVLNNTRSLHQLAQTSQKTKQQLDQQKQNINGIHTQIQQINFILEQLQKVHNDDNDNLMNQIEKLKQQYEKLLKLINALKNAKGTPQNQLHGDDKNIGSNKNINKLSQDRSFRKRGDSVDMNGKIRQLSQRIKYLEKQLSQENPQKLPSIGWKKPNQTSYNGQKSHKKELAEMKGDLQIWIKSYLATHNKDNGNFGDLQLKIQQIKNILLRKADHQGMKKGLAFLQGKITQLYLFLTQPESQDAMIVRKGFNCLSCSKKVETLRGKLGPRMNWDNLNSNPHNHTPPKVGFPKYADSNEKELN